jgi:hypothetical protein
MTPFGLTCLSRYLPKTVVWQIVRLSFDYLLLEMENGTKGSTQVGICIENALRLIFPYTSVGRTCMILFQVSLGKDFPVQPDTLATLAEAMRRTEAR